MQINRPPVSGKPDALNGRAGTVVAVLNDPWTSVRLDGDAATNLRTISHRQLEII